MELTSSTALAIKASPPQVREQSLAASITRANPLTQVSISKICEVAFIWLGHAEKFLSQVDSGIIKPSKEMVRVNIANACSLLEDRQYPNYDVEVDDLHFLFKKNKGLATFYCRNKHLYLKQICVNPKYIAEEVKGIGASFIECIAQFAKEHGISDIFLNPKNNTKSFYQKMGFKEDMVNLFLRVTPSPSPQKIPHNIFPITPFQPFIVSTNQVDILSNQLNIAGRYDLSEEVHDIYTLKPSDSNKIVLAMHSLDGKFLYASILHIEDNRSMKVVEEHSFSSDPKTTKMAHAFFKSLSEESIRELTYAEDSKPSEAKEDPPLTKRMKVVMPASGK